MDSFGHLSCQALWDDISIDKFKNDIHTDSVKTKLQNLEKRGDRPLYCQSMKTMYATILFRASTNNPERRYESQKILEEVLEKDKTNITSLADLIYIYEHTCNAWKAEVLKKRLIENKENDLALARTYYDRAHIIRHFEQDKRTFTYFKFLEMSRDHIKVVNNCNNERIETERAEILFDYGLSLYRKYHQKTEFGLLEKTEILNSNLRLEEAINGFLDVIDIKFSPGECTALSWIFIAILLRLKKSFDQRMEETASYANERLGDVTVEQCLEKGLQFSPQNANVLRRIASEYVHLNKIKEALIFFQSSIEIEESWFAFRHQGLLYLKMYNDNESDTKDDDYLSKAQNSFQKAIDLKETHADLSDLGYIFLLRGKKKIFDRKYKEGRDDLDKAIFHFAAAVNMTDCDDYCNPIETFERWGKCLQLTGDSKGLMQVRQMSIERESLLIQREVPANSIGEPDIRSIKTSVISPTNNEHDFNVVASQSKAESKSESDYEWVVKNLVPKLEDEFNLHGFLSERDKVLGEDYVKTLVNAIHSSRYNIMVLSPDFRSCNWCNYFMEIVVYSAVKRGSSVLVLMLQECEIPKQLQPFSKENLIMCLNKSIDAKQLQGIFNNT
ncbi:uncharacterized protein LOC117101647 [Anneissia japonica]|uniref:uncharacterized protein LOC117101647 n=1 Tax=Anneissia japonica TaxID=1529436 RepID=UPI0014258612|nr:uncharacterized protein LOC117101647 [Anneissia japonica]